MAYTHNRMKVKVLQSNLTKAISQAIHFTSVKAQLPILSNLLLKASKNSLSIQATNLEMSINIGIGAKVEKEGEIAVSAKVLFDIVNNLKSEQVELVVDKEILKVVTATFSGEVLALNTSDFPEIPSKLGIKATEIELTALKKALNKVVFAVSNDESRPILTGVLFEFTGKILNIIATDGFRLSLAKIKHSKDIGVQSLVVPKNILFEIQKLDEGGGLSFSASPKANQVSFAVPGALLSSRLLQGEFPNYKKIIPSRYTTDINTDKEEMINAVKLASVFARDASNVLRLKTQKGRVQLLAESSKTGKQVNNIDAKTEGEIIEIAFNFKYLLDGLSVIEAGGVTIELGGQNSPARLVDETDKDYLHLVMPVKI